MIRVDALKQIEGLNRKRLAAEPADLVARARLAWCLFMQALYQAGLDAEVLSRVPTPADTSPARAAGRTQEAERLLRECARQTVTVRLLSPDPREQSDMEKLQSLVRLSGAGPELAAAEEDGTRIMAEVTTEILRDRNPYVERLQRLPTQPRKGSPAVE